MLIYVYDQSDGKVYKKNRRRCSSLLFSISKRSFVGNLPYRIIKELILDMRKEATKSSKTLILVQSKQGGYMGWKGFYIGQQNLKFENFLLADSYIDLNI